MKNIKSYKYKNYGPIPQNEYTIANPERNIDAAAGFGIDLQADDTEYMQRLNKRQSLHPSARSKSGGWLRLGKVNGWRAESAAQNDEIAHTGRYSRYVIKSRPLSVRPAGLPMPEKIIVTERGITMKNERTYLKCEICGNIVGMIEDSGVSMMCCEQEMTPLAPNTVDATQEKHVPMAKWEAGKLIVNVGSIAHPMTEAHHIAWIAVAQGELTQRITLSHTGEPAAAFFMDNNAPVTVYAYCNLHGLWAEEV